MKKRKITKLSLRKNIISSLKASHLSGGTGTYDCWTFAPPCASFTEPPEDETFFCPPPNTGTNPPASNTCPTNQTCGFTCGYPCGGSATTCP